MKKIKTFFKNHRKSLFIGFCVATGLFLVVYLLFVSAVPRFFLAVLNFIVSNPFITIALILFLISIGIRLRFANLFGNFADRWKFASYLAMTTTAVVALLTRDVVVLQTAEKQLFKEEIEKKIELRHLKEKRVMQFKIDSLEIVATTKPTVFPVRVSVDSTLVWQLINERQLAANKKSLDTVLRSDVPENVPEKITRPTVSSPKKQDKKQISKKKSVFNEGTL